MKQIPLGAKGSFSLLVQPEHLADRFKDAILPPVFATPVIIMVMENAALNAIRAYLDRGERNRHRRQRVSRRRRWDGWLTGRPRSRKSTGARSSSPSEQPRAPRRSGSARIPGSSLTWLDSRG